MDAPNDDRFGFPDSHLTTALRALVPQLLARRGVTVEVRTDKRRFRPGEEIEIEIRFRNRLPVPVAIATPKRRLWGWTVDGRPAASDVPRYERDEPTAFAFRAREQKRVRRTWDGRFERDDNSVRESADPGEYEIAAFVATSGERPRDATTVEITE